MKFSRTFLQTKSGSNRDQTRNVKSSLFPSPPGFTLIELIMVLVIVGILSAITIPRFDSFFAIKLDGATKKLVSDIRYTQQLAISRHTNSRIVFNAAKDSYVAEKEVPRGSANWVNATDPFTRANLSVNFSTHSKYRGIDIQSPVFGGGSVLGFNWQGMPQFGGSVILFYRGKSRTISVEPNTGMVRAK